MTWSDLVFLKDPLAAGWRIDYSWTGMQIRYFDNPGKRRWRLGQGGGSWGDEKWSGPRYPQRVEPKWFTVDLNLRWESKKRVEDDAKLLQTEQLEEWNHHFLRWSALWEELIWVGNWEFCFGYLKVNMPIRHLLSFEQKQKNVNQHQRAISWYSLPPFRRNTESKIESIPIFYMRTCLQVVVHP